MILDRAAGRDVQELLRHEQRDERHHLEVGFQRAELLPHLGLAIGRRLIDRQLGRDRRLLERIGARAFLLRRHVDRDDVLAALDERLQHGLAERLLAVDHDTHMKYPSQNSACSPPPCGEGLGAGVFLRQNPTPLAFGERPSPQGGG
jgi:hypothetical protein